MGSYQAVLIAGPTASGKSQLALDVARLTGGVVINADSMQVYRDLRVLTARPSDAELQLATHALYGFVPGSEAYSVGQYVGDAGRLLAELKAAGRLPIFVGGTGLYFRGLLTGLSPVPPVPEDVRGRLRDEALGCDPRVLHARLAVRDPVMAARLAPSDSQRIVRALEVLEATGRSLAEWQRLPGVPLLMEAECLRLVMDVPRGEVYARCDRRFGQMIEEGAVAEVASLLARSLDARLPVMRAVGVAALAEFVEGRTSLEAAVVRAQTETRQYVKRQLTWLRRNMIAWKRADLKYNDVDLKNYLRL